MPARFTATVHSSLFGATHQGVPAASHATYQQNGSLDKSCDGLHTESFIARPFSCLMITGHHQNDVRFIAEIYFVRYIPARCYNIDKGMDVINYENAVIILLNNKHSLNSGFGTGFDFIMKRKVDL